MSDYSLENYNVILDKDDFLLTKTRKLKKNI